MSSARPKSAWTTDAATAKTLVVPHVQAIFGRVRTLARRQHAAALIRPAGPGDLDALVALEDQVFLTDRISRRSFRRFLTSPSAQMLAADCEGAFAGYALVLFRQNADVARLYSIGVAPQFSRRGVGAALLAAAEDAALERNCTALRFEVHEENPAAVALYRRSGYREFGRHPDYYEDGGTALRFEKRLAQDCCASTARRPISTKPRSSRADRPA